ncbi:MAG: hypothetical protein JO256_08680 [Alphaproteobacteria bacterium]|nr:hypothetical protein [Alphaproteobacteria bacterium]
MKFRALIGGVVAAAMLSSATLAATPLPAGKPAGVQKATVMGISADILIGVAMVAVVVIAITGGFSETHSAQSTGSPFVPPGQSLK